MTSSLAKTLFLVLIAAVITAATAPLWLKPADSFDLWLLRIAEEHQPEAALKNAEAWLDFQSHTLGADEDAANRLASLHFQLAQALTASTHPDNGAAMRHYLACIEAAPDHRHGWPYFLAAQLMEDSHAPGARDVAGMYQRAADHDFGKLALNAGFRIALWNSRAASLGPQDPRGAYQFIRFVSKNPARDAEALKDALWLDRPEAMYLRALAAADPGEAREAMSGFARLRPEDASARYYLDRWSGEARGTYPEDGGLLASFAAPRAFEAPEPLLTQNAELMADFFIAGASAGRVIEINVEFENPSRTPLEFAVRCNGQEQTFTLNGDRRRAIAARFANAAERNLIEAQPRFQTDTPSSNDLWVRLTRLDASAIDAENAAESAR
ncbi:MAG: hypothetical protein GC154_07755 [bacterium]|nr:hypothetical protein [bacterium]